MNITLKIARTQEDFQNKENLKLIAINNAYNEKVSAILLNYETKKVCRS